MKLNAVKTLNCSKFTNHVKISNFTRAVSTYLSVIWFNTVKNVESEKQKNHAALMTSNNIYKLVTSMYVTTAYIVTQCDKILLCLCIISCLTATLAAFVYLKLTNRLPNTPFKNWEYSKCRILSSTVGSVVYNLVKGWDETLCQFYD